MTPVLLALLEDAMKYDVVKIKIPAKIHIFHSHLYPYDVSKHLKPEPCSRIVVKESTDGIEFSLRLAYLFILDLFLSAAITVFNFLLSHHTNINELYFSVRITRTNGDSSWRRRSDLIPTQMSRHWRRSTACSKISWSAEQAK